MPSERHLTARFPQMGWIAILAAALGLGAVVFLNAREGAVDRAPGRPLVESVRAAEATAGAEPERASSPTSPTPLAPLPASARRELPSEVLQAIQNGSQESLTPPVIHVDAEPAPGSVITAEPLVPKVIAAEAEPAPGAVATSEPLIPPVIEVSPAPRAP